MKRQRAERRERGERLPRKRINRIPYGVATALEELARRVEAPIPELGPRLPDTRLRPESRGCEFPVETFADIKKGRFAP